MVLHKFYKDKFLFGGMKKTGMNSCYEQNGFFLVLRAIKLPW
jgi:hypothetical protein